MPDRAETGFPDVVIDGEGVVLRKLKVDQDLSDIVAACSDPETQRWLPLPSPYGDAQAREFCEVWSVQQQRSGDGLVRAIESAGRLAGCIDLKHTDWLARTSEIGYWSAPWARGRGLMTQAVRALSEWALRTQKLRRLELRIAPDNAASRRVAEKANFILEGIAREAGYTHEGQVDLAVYSLIPSDLSSP